MRSLQHHRLHHHHHLHHHRRCCCCFWRWREALCQPGTRSQLVCRGGGRGEHPASPTAGRTEAPCSCTSCCRDAPCLCCCRQNRRKGDEELEWTSQASYIPASSVQFYRDSQSMAGHAEQGSVTSNNATTAVAPVCLLTDWSVYSL